MMGRAANGSVIVYHASRTAGQSLAVTAGREHYVTFDVVWGPLQRLEAHLLDSVGTERRDRQPAKALQPRFEHGVAQRRRRRATDAVASQV